MNTELKSCPFCGSTIASYRVTRDRWGKIGEIVCPGCEAVFYYAGVQSSKMLKDKWNRRVPDEPENM